MSIRVFSGPIAPAAESDDRSPLFYPLPEFILSDILELAQAHASYRFILSDEATNERRLLVSTEEALQQSLF